MPIVLHLALSGHHVATFQPLLTFTHGPLRSWGTHATRALLPDNRRGSHFMEFLCANCAFPAPHHTDCPLHPGNGQGRRAREYASAPTIYTPSLGMLPILQFRPFSYTTAAFIDSGAEGNFNHAFACQERIGLEALCRPVHKIIINGLPLTSSPITVRTTSLSLTIIDHMVTHRCQPTTGTLLQVLCCCPSRLSFP